MQRDIFKHKVLANLFSLVLFLGFTINVLTLSELKHKQIHLQQQILELKNDMETFNVRLVS